MLDSRSVAEDAGLQHQRQILWPATALNFRSQQKQSELAK